MPVTLNVQVIKYYLYYIYIWGCYTEILRGEQTRHFAVLHNFALFQSPLLAWCLFLDHYNWWQGPNGFWWCRIKQIADQVVQNQRIIPFWVHRNISVSLTRNQMPYTCCQCVKEWGGGGEGWNSCAFKCAQWLGENWLVFPRWLCFKTLSGFKTFAVKEYQWYLLSISVGFSVLMYQGRSGHFAVLNSVEHCRSRRMQIVFLYLHHVLTVAAP